MQRMIFFTHRNGMPSFATLGIWIKYHILFETAHLCLNVVLLEPSIFSTPKKNIRKKLGGIFRCSNHRSGWGPRKNTTCCFTINPATSKPKVISVAKFRPNVGKYTVPYIEHLGMGLTWCFTYFLMFFCRTLCINKNGFVCFACEGGSLASWDQLAVASPHSLKCS